jgi:hypothetical protein
VGLCEGKIVRHLRAPSWSEADPRSMAPVSVLNRPRSPRRQSRSGGMLRIADPFCGLIVEGRAEDQESHPRKAGSGLPQRWSGPSCTLFLRTLHQPVQVLVATPEPLDWNGLPLN